MPPRVSSENTTPKPNVSSAAFRSQTVISCPGPSCLARAAKYRPPGPPPVTAIRTLPPLPSTGQLSPATLLPTVCRKKDDRQYGNISCGRGDDRDTPAAASASQRPES